MYEIFESQVDNIEISREYNYLRNYKIEEINGGGYCWIFFMEILRGQTP